jgi:hypothetical protein
MREIKAKRNGIKNSDYIGTWARTPTKYMNEALDHDLMPLQEYTVVTAPICVRHHKQAWMAKTRNIMSVVRW